MRKYIFILCVSAFTLFLGSCQNKDSYLNDFRAFIAELEEDSKDYNDKDWKDAGKTFKELIEEGEEYRKEMSLTETLEMKKMELKFQSFFTKAKGKQMWNELNESLEEAGEEIENALEDLGNQLQK